MSIPPHSPVIHAEIEPPRPLRAGGGELDAQGWCFIAGRPEAPAVRARGGRHILPVTERRDRPDVAALFADQAVPTGVGFRIHGTLPAGVTVVDFEAEVAPGEWRTFRRLTVAAEWPPLRFAIEWPRPQGSLRDRIPVEGWVFSPDGPVERLDLRYGHQEMPCDLGRVRPDVAELFPDAPHARTAGFRSRRRLRAAHGAVRLRATTAAGRTLFATTGLHVDINRDGGIGPEFRLGSPRIGLPGYDRRERAAPTPVAEPLNVLFVLPGDFSSNSALHVIALADRLAAAGHRCAVTVPDTLETLAAHDAPRFTALTHDVTRTEPVRFADGRGPDVIHAWTPRENVRQVAEQVHARDGGRLVVHLEDHELHLLAAATGRPEAELLAANDEELDRLVTPRLAHPRRSEALLRAADGVTVVLDRLRELAPDGRPCLTLWPAADERYFFPRAAPTEFRALLARRPDEFFLAYHGNVHAANAAEVAELYAAVVKLNDEGVPVTLIRTGLDPEGFPGELARRIAPHLLHLGQIVHHRHLPPLLAVADCFVQPGAPGPFNDYRFPSKLPEFFALGRPVILPRTNLGEHVRHGLDAWVVERGDAAGIAAAVRMLHGDPALAARLAAGAVAFAREHFDWRRNAEALAAFYAEVAAVRS